MKPQYILILVFALFVAVAGFEYGKNTAKPIIQSVTTTEQPVVKTEDKNENIHETIIARALTTSEMKVITDSIRKSLKADAITGTSLQTQKIDTEFITIPIYVDTTNKTIFAIDSDRWHDIQFNGSFITKKGSFKIKMEDPLSEIHYTKKYLFKANDEEIDFIHSNHLFTTTKAYEYHVQTPKPILVFGPSIIISVDGTLHAGFSCTYNLFSIKSK